MIHNGIEYFPVTDDADKLARLRELADRPVGSRRLAEFAASELGLTPPGFREGDPLSSIVEVFRPDMDHGVLVWDIHEYRDEELGED
ncbi:hypothetical protein LX16_0223 [Stackebrandtia albiflava]|uniref:Uncharacterized protein n=1 Tax=Stackebrandtia albiflava TaxID=406432 RepID=A0A562V9L9_9ACTN|nr:hypothetical protein [Stackebrandtia albiflava]TWJ14538.1 hypothetical protein LX16_0223 [Stackebrandtia albiflava]